MSSSSNVLTSSHGGSHVSQSGLAKILQEVRDHGLPKTLSRSSVKRARDNAIPHDLFTTVLLVDDSGAEHRYPAVNPWKQFEWMVQDIPSFKQYIQGVLQTDPVSAASPWGICLYSDEILPGNALKARDDRKVIAFYCSFKQLGKGLSSEDLWWHICSLRANCVRDSAGDGWSQLFLQVCNLFFTSPHDASAGVHLELGEGLPPFWFAKVDLVIGDGAALAACWSLKGASGTKPCFYCQNVFLHGLNLHLHDSSGRLVSHVECDVSKLALETDESILNSAKMLRDNFGTASRAQFERMEKAVGIVHTMRGPMNCDHLLQRLNGGPISVTQMDWMHIYCVNGVFNTECGFLLESLRAAGLKYADLDKYLQGFKYPKQLQSKGTTGSKTLKGYDGGEVKCSASEALAVYPCIRLMLMTLVPDEVPQDTTLAIVSFHALCEVLDLLQQDKKLGNVDPDTLHGAVERHVTFRIAAYGEDRQQPKVHWSLHLSSMKRLQPVLTCWVHERKHKEIKRVANDVANANRTVGFEKSMLTSVLLAQQEALKGLAILDGVALVNPKPASEAIAYHAKIAAGCTVLDSVEHAHDVFLGPGQLCASKDVAIATVQGAEAVVEVWFHVLVANHVHMTVVSPWAPAGTNLFRKQDDPLFIPTSDIQRCCIYHPTSEPGVVAVVP